jgi:hypothetical protein
MNIEIDIEYLGKVIDQIFIEVEHNITNKMKDVIINSIIEAGEEEQKVWVENVKKRLSDPISKSMLHIQRKPRTRLFPYLNTGRLRDSVQTKLYKLNYNTNNNYVVLRWWFGILAPQATYTNKAVNSPDNPGWKGWVDRVFTGINDKYVISARRLVRNFVAFRVNEILKGRVV